MKRSKSRITLLDVVLLALLFGVAAAVIYRVQVRLIYHWNWGVLPQYVLRRESVSGHWVPGLLLQGLFTTLRLSLWGTLLATAIGTAMGLLRVSHRPFRYFTGRAYVETVRNLPPLVLVFICYYFLSDQLMPLLGIESMARGAPAEMRRVLSWLLAPPERLAAFLSALIALALFEGAYITEIVRGGIASIGRGQHEAAMALGFTGPQRMRHIVLPQAVIRILPPLAGQFISTIKDSAIVSVISIQDLSFQGMELMASTYLTMEVWITITLLYLLLTLPCSLAVARFESAMRRRIG